MVLLRKKTQTNKAPLQSLGYTFIITSVNPVFPPTGSEQLCSSSVSHTSQPCIMTLTDFSIIQHNAATQRKSIYCVLPSSLLHLYQLITGGWSGRVRIAWTAGAGGQKKQEGLWLATVLSTISSLSLKTKASVLTSKAHSPESIYH